MRENLKDRRCLKVRGVNSHNCNKLNKTNGSFKQQ